MFGCKKKSESRSLKEIVMGDNLFRYEWFENSRDSLYSDYPSGKYFTYDLQLTPVDKEYVGIDFTITVDNPDIVYVLDTIMETPRWMSRHYTEDNIDGFLTYPIYWLQKHLDERTTGKKYVFKYNKNVSVYDKIYTITRFVNAIWDYATMPGLVDIFKYVEKLNIPEIRISYPSYGSPCIYFTPYKFALYLEWLRKRYPDEGEHIDRYEDSMAKKFAVKMTAVDAVATSTVPMLSLVWKELYEQFRDDNVAEDKRMEVCGSFVAKINSAK